MTSPLLDQTHHADRIFTEEDLRGVRVEAREFQDCEFLRCVLAEAELVGCRFASCTFRECDLSLVKVVGSRFSGVVLEKSKVIGVDWTVADWPKVAPPGAIGFTGCAINHSTFLGLSLAGIRIVDCMARETDFREADLTKADFGGTDLTGALFSSTNLTEADLSLARRYSIVPGENRLTGAKFSMPEAMALIYGLDIEIVE